MLFALSVAMPSSNLMMAHICHLMKVAVIVLSYVRRAMTVLVTVAVKHFCGVTMTRNELIAKLDSCHPYSCQDAFDVAETIKARKREAFLASMSYLDTIQLDRTRLHHTHTQCQSMPRQSFWSAILHYLNLGRLGK